MQILDKTDTISDSDCCWPGCDSRRGGKRKAEEYPQMWRPSIRALIDKEERSAALHTIFRAETLQFSHIRSYKALEGS